MADPTTLPMTVRASHEVPADGSAAGAAQPKDKRQLVLAVPMLVGVLFTTLLVFVSSAEKGKLGGTAAGASGGESLSAQEVAFADSSMSLSVTGDYDQPSSMDYYPWDYVLEPYREMTMTATDMDSAFSSMNLDWTISPVDEDGTVLSDVSATTYKNAESVSYTCETPGSLLEVSIVPSGTSSTSSARKTFSAVCKYVRRNIYDLTDADRESFLQAYATVATTEYTEGVKTYGSSFVNVAYHTAKHALNSIECTPYHGAWSFLTSHEAFVYEIERAMRLVDPTVSMHYWDFPRDFDAYNTDGTLSGVYESKIFSFIGRGDEDNDWRFTNGPFKDLQMPHKTDALYSSIEQFNPTWNAYGYIGDYGSANPSAYVQRTESICGYSGSFSTPGCADVLTALKQTTSSDFFTRLDADVHVMTHAWGGYDSCAADFAALDDATGMVASFSWTTNFETSVEKNSDGYTLTCPDDWSDGERYNETSGSPTCLSTCSGFLDYFGLEAEDVLEGERESTWSTLREQITWTSAMQYMRQSGVETAFTELYGLHLTTAYNDEMDAEVPYFEGLSEDQNDVAFAHILLFSCVSPTTTTPLASPFVSPLDPVFYPLHAYFNRMLEARRIVPDFSTYGADFVSDDSCYGRGEDDKLPFYDFMSDTSGEWYSNADLYDMFDPTSVSLPHIFDDLDWSSCSSTTDDASS